MLEAVKQFGCALQYASAALQNDREIVLEASNRMVLRYLMFQDELQDDHEIVLDTVRKDGSTLEYASEALNN